MAWRGRAVFRRVATKPGQVGVCLLVRQWCFHRPGDCDGQCRVLRLEGGGADGLPLRLGEVDTTQRERHGDGLTAVLNLPGVLEVALVVRLQVPGEDLL